MANSLERYRAEGHRSVDGWLLEGAIDATCEIADAQSARGVRGPVCEIGVHHGRLFILLQLLTAPAERSLAMDLFEKQDENIDESGKGSREHLVDNLRRHGCDEARIELLAENSLHITPEQIVALCGGKVRLFSVDGGHTAEITRNDLRLADASLCEGGVVILDDYFNTSWPAVSEGANLYMSQDRPQFVPVLISSNKFFFAKGEDAAAEYRDRLLSRRPGAKISEVFGSPVVCHEPMERHTLRQVVASHPQWTSIRDTGFGKAVRSLVGR
jgi:Methyltransferase domain